MVGWIDLRRVLRAALLLLVITLAPAQAADRWVDTVNAARLRALREGKPVLCLVVAPGSDASKRFVALIDRNRSLQPLLDQFVCAKLDKNANHQLVSRYHMASFPSLLFTTPGGRAMKLIVGRVTTAKVRGQLKEVLAKWETLKDPRTFVPKTRKRSPVPVTPETSLLHPSTCPHRCPHCEPAIDRALAWLSRQQKSDGAWRKLSSETVTKTEKGQDFIRSIDHIDVALTSLAAMALLAEGSTTREGRFRGQVARAAGFLRRGIRDDGIISHARGMEWLYLITSNFETSLGAMFLCELEKREPDAEQRAGLQRVADLLQQGQDPRSGGWGYSFDSPQHSAMDKRGWRLLATTHCAMTALTYLRDAGLEVDPQVFQRGAKYLKWCRTREDGFAYRVELRGTKGYAGMTAGALFSLSRAGVRDDAALLAARARHRRDYRNIHDFGEHWWWFLLYTALEMNDNGEGAWRDFDAHFRNVLLENQFEDGSWAEPDEKAGRVFSTAIATLVLQLEKGNLPISARRSRERVIEAVARPRYLKPPHPDSRVKVFEHDDGYLVDLTISIDGPAGDAYLRDIEHGVRGANRALYDVTDGQMSMHRVRIVPGGGEADTADILITTGFYEDPDVPSGGAHGVTMVSKRTEIRGTREVEGVRIGEWVKLPYHLRGLPGREPSVVPWQNRGLIRVMAHELCHYLFGVQDEYGVGGIYCNCFLGNLQHSELCRDHDHTDDRREHSCWSAAERLYPLLDVPEMPDPGPWDPPTPIFEIVR